MKYMTNHMIELSKNESNGILTGNIEALNRLGILINEDWTKKPIGAKVNPKYYGDFRLQFQLTDNEETNEFYNIPVSITKDVEKYIFIYED